MKIEELKEKVLSEIENNLWRLGVSKIIDYVGNTSLTVDSESTSEPSNIIHNIPMVQGGFFKSN